MNALRAGFVSALGGSSSRQDTPPRRVGLAGRDSSSYLDTSDGTQSEGSETGGYESSSLDFRPPTRAAPPPVFRGPDRAVPDDLQCTEEEASAAIKENAAAADDSEPGVGSAPRLLMSSAPRTDGPDADESSRSSSNTQASGADDTGRADGGRANAFCLGKAWDAKVAAQSPRPVSARTQEAQQLCGAWASRMAVDGLADDEVVDQNEEFGLSSCSSSSSEFSSAMEDGEEGTLPRGAAVHSSKSQPASQTVSELHSAHSNVASPRLLLADAKSKTPEASLVEPSASTASTREAAAEHAGDLVDAAVPSSQHEGATEPERAASAAVSSLTIGALPAAPTARIAAAQNQEDSPQTEAGGNGEEPGQVATDVDTGKHVAAHLQPEITGSEDELLPKTLLQHTVECDKVTEMLRPDDEKQLNAEPVKLQAAQEILLVGGLSKVAQPDVLELPPHAACEAKSPAADAKSSTTEEFSSPCHRLQDGGDVKTLDVLARADVNSTPERSTRRLPTEGETPDPAILELPVAMALHTATVQPSQQEHPEITGVDEEKRSSSDVVTSVAPMAGCSDNGVVGAAEPSHGAVQEGKPSGVDAESKKMDIEATESPSHDGRPLPSEEERPVLSLDQTDGSDKELEQVGSPESGFRTIAESPAKRTSTPPDSDDDSEPGFVFATQGRSPTFSADGLDELEEIPIDREQASPQKRACAGAMSSLRDAGVAVIAEADLPPPPVEAAGGAARAGPSAAACFGSMTDSLASVPEAPDIPEADFPEPPTKASLADPAVAADAKVHVASESAQPAQDSLRVGDRVLLHGLKATPDLNGLEGICAAWLPDRGRWQVQILNDELEATMALKADNLLPAAGAEAQLKRQDLDRSGTASSFATPEPRSDSASVVSASASAGSSHEEGHAAGTADAPSTAADVASTAPTPPDCAARGTKTSEGSSPEGEQAPAATSPAAAAARDDGEARAGGGSSETLREAAERPEASPAGEAEANGCGAKEALEREEEEEEESSKEPGALSSTDCPQRSRGWKSGCGTPTSPSKLEPIRETSPSALDPPEATDSATPANAAKPPSPSDRATSSDPAVPAVKASPASIEALPPVKRWEAPAITKKDKHRKCFCFSSAKKGKNPEHIKAEYDLKKAMHAREAEGLQAALERGYEVGLDEADLEDAIRVLRNCEDDAIRIRAEANLKAALTTHADVQTLTHVLSEARAAEVDAHLLEEAQQRREELETVASRSKLFKK
eukprot:TRINITY_DN21241_c1_g2_i1.p1 TRINITY_DN21241_c1_g2~~TRINITY_DN21241_c1_g2_i1.p1  ORF type:complete len:1241 (-),score=309.96 TRINITY_DN21241_c1_g2_i1:144-3866(-)